MAFRNHRSHDHAKSFDFEVRLNQFIRVHTNPLANFFDHSTNLTTKRSISNLTHIHRVSKKTVLLRFFGEKFSKNFFQKSPIRSIFM
jgi:hypothetical protein